jgi:cold shock CspA family protein
MSNRKTGKLKSFLSEKRFGFIETQNDELFFHLNESKGLEINLLEKGVMLSYEESVNSRNGKLHATNVMIEK